MMTPKDVLAFAKENDAKVLDIRFLDFPGVWQHFTVPMSELDEGSFEDGYGFDAAFIQLAHRNGEVLPDAGEVQKTDIEDFGVILLSECQYIFGCHHASSL